MEEKSNEKSVTFMSVKNTYKYIEAFIGETGVRQLSEPRKSVDLERMFFGKHTDSEGSDDEEGDTNKHQDRNIAGDSSSQRKPTRSSKTGLNLSTESSKNQNLKDEENESNYVSFDDPGTPTGIKSPDLHEKVTFAGSASLMARFYSRLNEIRNAKQQTGGSPVTPSDSNGEEKNDRRRIRTALRRLLTERLFPDIRPASPVKPLPAGGDNQYDLPSGTVTPYTIGTRSKTGLSLQSENGDEKRHSTPGNKGGVLLVDSFDQSTENDTEEENGIDKQETLGYYRRHQLQVKKANVSRLYQPAKNNNTNNAGVALTTKDAILKDPEFIKSLRAQIGKFNNKTGEPGTRNKTRPNISWAYNNIPRKGNGNGTPGDRRHSTDVLAGKEMEDWQLKKLLEELYQDKKYMDSLILSTGDNTTEEEITKSLKSGREYLLKRASYWLERGPQPSRPPTSALGLRLEREQSMMSARTPRQNKEPFKRKDTSSSVDSHSREDNGVNSSRGSNRQKY